MTWMTSLEECSPSTVVLSIVSIIGLVYILYSKRPKNFPPGPLGLPIVGYIPFLGRNAGMTLTKMKATYGKILSVRIGMEYWVILNDYDLIKEALVKQGEIFSGRPRRYMFERITGGYGIINLDYGPTWRSQSKFGSVAMRGFGLGKQRFEEKIREETSFLVDSLLNDDKETITMKLTLASSNLISRLMLGSRFAYDDEKLLQINRTARTFLSSDFDAKLIGVVSIAPSLRHIPPFREAFESHMKDWSNILGIYRDIIQEHKKSFREDDLRDFIDAYLMEMNRRSDDTSFSEEQLVVVIKDIFEAGSGTTSSTLGWALLSFINYPEYQERIAEEVERVIGDSGVASMKHRDEMPYTCAFIQELMRYKTPLPLSAPHNTSEDTTIAGFRIPKHTVVAPNIWSVHMNSEFFDNPEEFRPERFLDKDGKFLPSNHVIPFSIGPRHCLGEQLARMELFIFITGIVQRIEILSDPNNPPPPFETIDFQNFVTFEPPEYSAIFRNR